ncbi:MAG: hypothetical protein ACP5MV_01560 [Candidatus Parvarchaeum sp.]
MIKDTKKNSLNELLEGIMEINRGDTKFLGEGASPSSFSEYILSANSGDIKINKMGVYSNSKAMLIDYYVLVSVSNGKKYEPVLYFTKKTHVNEEMLERTKPDLNLIDKGLIPEVFSKAIGDYYLIKNLEYKFEIGYIRKGDWIKDILKFAKIQEENIKEWEDMFDAWCKDKV